MSQSLRIFFQVGTKVVNHVAVNKAMNNPQCASGILSFDRLKECCQTDIIHFILDVFLVDVVVPKILVAFLGRF